MEVTRYARGLNKGLFWFILLALLLALALPIGNAGVAQAQPGAVTITDSFEDETRIASKENVAVDTAAGQVELDAVLSATYGGSGRDRFYSVYADSDYIYAAGYTDSEGQGGNDALLVKFNKAGLSIAARKVCGRSKNDYFWSIYAEGDYIYAAGYTDSEGQGGNDALLVKFNKADLSIASRKVYGGSSSGQFHSVYADGDYIYAAGHTYSEGQGGNDALLVKFHKSLPSGSYTGCGFTFQDSELTLADSKLTPGNSGLTSDDSELTLDDSGLTLADSTLTLVSCPIYTSGILSSTNLLSGQTVTSIESFGYEASSIPSETSLKVQFSQDSTNWYNSAGTLKGCDTLSAGSHSIDLSSLNWSGANFYYRAGFTSDGGDTPILDEISVTASGPQPPPPPPTGVGGEAYPINKLAILLPWIGLIAALLAGATIVIRRRTQG